MGCGRTSKDVVEINIAKDIVLPEKQDTEAVSLSRSSFVRKKTGLIEDEYIPGKVIGDGAFGEVI